MPSHAALISQCEIHLQQSCLQDACRQRRGPIALPTGSSIHRGVSKHRKTSKALQKPAQAQSTHLTALDVQLQHLHVARERISPPEPIQNRAIRHCSQQTTYQCEEHGGAEPGP